MGLCPNEYIHQLITFSLITKSGFYFICFANACFAYTSSWSSSLNKTQDLTSSIRWATFIQKYDAWTSHKIKFIVSKCSKVFSLPQFTYVFFFFCPTMLTHAQLFSKPQNKRYFSVVSIPFQIQFGVKKLFLKEICEK